jgi:hypothetical protein
MLGGNKMIKKILVAIVALALIAISIASASAASYYASPYYHSANGHMHGANVDSWGMTANRPFYSYQYSTPRYIAGPNSVFNQPRNSYNPIGMNRNTYYGRNSYNPIGMNSYNYGNSYGGYGSYGGYNSFGGSSRGGAGFSLFGITADFGYH